MSLLPLPSRLPARKHLAAAGFGLLGLALMVGAVLSASGLRIPFTSGDPERVRAGTIVLDLPTTTTSPGATTTTTRRSDIPLVVDPAAIAGPAPTSRPDAPRPAPTTTTSTTLVPPPPTTPRLVPPLGLGGL